MHDRCRGGSSWQRPVGLELRQLTALSLPGAPSWRNLVPPSEVTTRALGPPDRFLWPRPLLGSRAAKEGAQGSPLALRDHKQQNLARPKPNPPLHLLPPDFSSCTQSPATDLGMHRSLHGAPLRAEEGGSVGRFSRAAASPGSLPDAPCTCHRSLSSRTLPLSPPVPTGLQVDF